jgi:competence protein ComGC
MDNRRGRAQCRNVKTCCHQRHNSALTLVEVLVVILVLVVLVVMLLPALKASRRYASRVSCAGNVKQILLTFRVWSQDHNDLFPMQVSVANGGAMELAVSGNVVAVFQVMSNELSTPMVLRCAYDEQHSYTRNFTNLAATNISYFVGLDAGMTNSGNVLLSGDANLTLRGKPVKSGLLDLASNAPVAWDTSRADRHSEYGNIGLSDGSVMTTVSGSDNLQRLNWLAPACVSTLTNLLRSTGLATNHLVIP